MNQSMAVCELQRFQELVDVVSDVHGVEAWVQTSKVYVVHEFKHHTNVYVLLGGLVIIVRNTARWGGSTLSPCTASMNSIMFGPPRRRLRASISFLTFLMLSSLNSFMANLRLLESRHSKTIACLPFPSFGCEFSGLIDGSVH